MSLQQIFQGTHIGPDRFDRSEHVKDFELDVLVLDDGLAALDSYPGVH
ncbi:MAG: hypothetical protein JRI34_07390 [Deltaproteobacteria bacterium]|nr:hypothetical protein [Deltaproteobacteria bacterium]